MDANLSATLENSPEPEGNDIRRAPAGYLVHSGRVIVRAAKVHHMNIRSAELRTPAGPRPPAGSVEWWPKEPASRMGISRVLEGNIRDRHQAPQLLQSDTPDGPASVEGPDLWPAATGAGNRRPSWLTSDHYFEAELERPIRLQVVAGPRFEPANVLVASRLSKGCCRELYETTGENVTLTKHGFESRWGREPVVGLTPRERCPRCKTLATRSNPRNNPPGSPSSRNPARERMGRRVRWRVQTDLHREPG